MAEQAHIPADETSNDSVYCLGTTYSLPIHCLCTAYSLPMCTHPLCASYKIHTHRSPRHTHGRYMHRIHIYAACPLPMHCLFNRTHTGLFVTTCRPTSIFSFMWLSTHTHTHMRNTHAPHTHIRCLFTAYSLPIHCLFTVYSLSIQPHTHTHTHTHTLALYWLSIRSLLTTRTFPNSP
jgi:hypothetical protein